MTGWHWHRWTRWQKVFGKPSLFGVERALFQERYCEVCGRIQRTEIRWAG